MAGFTINYKAAGPTTARFHASKAFIRGILGPIGSGKSVACCADLFKAACEQEPCSDGVRRTRWVIVRNTYPELKSTTIKTWLDWFPERIFGAVKWDVPITHRVRFGDVDMEVLFLALDRPDHVGKLLSLEVTGGWINEARELPKPILDALTGRVGRYPSMRDKPEHIPKECWPTASFVIMDTNPPDDDHWWHQLAEGSDDPDEDAKIKQQLLELEERLIELGALKPGQPLMEFFSQPSGRSPRAENLNNLPVGYYQKAMIGKNEEWIKVYVDGQYGSIIDGKVVYPEWNQDIHLAKTILVPMRGLPLCIGFDFGRTPAAIFGQMTPRGQLRIIDELFMENMGVKQFADTIVKPHIANNYAGMKLIVRGDPAGQSKESDERSAFDMLVESQLMIEAAPTNFFLPRREAVAHFMNRMVDGQPGFLLSPKCKILRKGFNGGYHFRKMLVPGEAKYTLEPDKNRYSHPHDALQYLALHYHNPGSNAGRRSGATAGTRSRHEVADSIAGY